MPHSSTLPAGFERRREDYGLITGHSRYVDDLKPAGRPAPLHMVVVRSPYAHAIIKEIQLDAARALPGIVAAFASAELVSGMPPMDSFPVPGMKKPERRPLAVGRARYVGDPVAIVLAEDLYTALDARDMVEVDYEPMQAVTDPEQAVNAGAPLLYEEFGTNIAFFSQSGGGDIEATFKDADRTVRLRVVNQRLAPSSIEPRACMFDLDPHSGQFSAWVSSQAIYRTRDALANFLGIERGRIHVHNAEVGGGYGAKTAFVGEEIIAATLALKFERPVKWIESRSENLQAQTHGRGQINYIEAAYQNDGQLLGLKVRTIADLGAFLAFSTALVPVGTPTMLSGAYRLKAVESKVIAAYTNKVPTGAYRGAGRPEAAYILERTMDRIAHELGLDPAEVRRRNFIAPDSFPYHTVTGAQYDSGNYAVALDRALELADYAGWRAQQKERRAANSAKLLGIGISTFTEVSGGSLGPPRPGIPQEAATVRIRRDGTILVQSGVATNGQGHFTAFAQIAATTFNLSSATYSSGAHIAIVEVDSDTGDVRILRYVAVDDCGRVLNHYLAEAQVHGGLAQGIGQALYEEAVYDEEGQLLTSSLMDYALPIADQIPDFVTASVETPSPINPLGAKGVGEAGCIAAPPAIVNAVLDALAPSGIKSTDMPLRSEKIRSLIQAAHNGTLVQGEVAPPAVFSQVDGSKEGFGQTFV